MSDHFDNLLTVEAIKVVKSFVVIHLRCPQLDSCANTHTLSQTIAHTQRCRLSVKGSKVGQGNKWLLDLDVNVPVTREMREEAIAATFLDNSDAGDAIYFTDEPYVLWNSSDEVSLLFSEMDYAIDEGTETSNDEISRSEHHCTPSPPFLPPIP